MRAFLTVQIKRDRQGILPCAARSMCSGANPAVLNLLAYERLMALGRTSGTGSVHVPVDQLAAALQLSPSQWEAAYHCHKPDPEDYLILQSRTNGRAAWAAQIAYDHGYRRCLVHRQVGCRAPASPSAYRRHTNKCSRTRACAQSHKRTNAYAYRRPVSTDFIGLFS